MDCWRESNPVKNKRPERIALRPFVFVLCFPKRVR